MEKNCLFQYYKIGECIEDTELITRKEADELWEKYIPDVIKNWNDYDRPQMVIWTNCDSNTDYNFIEKEIDFRDCVLENGSFYRVKKEKI